MADDLDFEAVERLLDNAEGVALAGEAEKEKSRRRSRSRRRDRRRDREERDGGNKDRDRGDRGDRDRGDRDRGDRDRRRDRDEGVDEDPAERERRKAEEAAKKEQERMERRKREEEEERQRLADEATRGDRTVFVTNVSGRAGEREVYEFFSKFAGKVRDVQIIRDQRSHKSKGVCYVEFYLQETVMKALSLSGQVLDNNPIRVVPSQADKNRAAQVVAKTILPPPGADSGMKLYIGGLTDTLANITEDELRKLFSPFGNIQFIDLHRDPYTNKCKGYAFVMFDKALEAKEALTAMNNFELAGQRLKVGLATEHPVPGTSSPLPQALTNTPTELGGLTESLTDEGPGNHPGLLKDANARMALMQKLQRDTPMGPGAPGSASVLARPPQPGMPSMSGMPPMPGMPPANPMMNLPGGAPMNNISPGMMPPQNGMPGGMPGSMPGGMQPGVQNGMQGMRPGMPMMGNAMGGGPPGMGGPPMMMGGQPVMGMGGPPAMGGMPMGGMGGPPMGGGLMNNGPSTNVCLKHMFNPNGIDLDKEPSFFRDIEEDVFQECNSHGQVQKVVVDKGSQEGCVYVRFGNVGSAIACQRALDRRWFAGQQIQAGFTDDVTFAQKANI